MKRFIKYRTFSSLLISGFIILLIASFRNVDPYSDGADTLKAEKFWILKAKHKGKHDIIAIGDSRVYRSISPSAIEKILPGWSAYNFGFSGGGLNTAIYKIAEKLLNKKGKKIILMGVTPDALTSPSSANTQMLQEARRPESALFERVYINPLLKNFIPFDHNKLLKRSNQPIYINEYYNDGWVASQKFPEDTMEAISIYQSELERYKAESLLIKELIEQVRYWNKKGIKVFAFRPPTSYQMVKLEDSISGLNYKNFIIQFEEAGGRWINVNRRLYHSYDGSHIDKGSAISLSEFIAENIKRR